MLMAELIAPRKTVSVTFSLEPAYNAIASLSLLDIAEDFTGLGEWVYRTAEVLSPQERHTNRHVLGDAVIHLLGEASWPSFEAWVDDLAARDAEALRDDVVHALFAKAYDRADREMPAPAEILADSTAFLTLVEEIHAGKREPPERALWEDTRGMLIDPPLVQERIVTHLRTLWEGGLAAEWKRHLPVLEESIAAFQLLDMSGLTAIEALMRVSLREVPPPGLGGWDEVERIIFIPSAHTGPYLLHFGSHGQTMARVIYGARVPEGAAIRSPALSRSELLMRLNALANDTRLRILELLAPQEELSTSEIMERLDLSQSAASRHLEHLAATGYLIMRGDKRANLYLLNPDQIDRTFRALKAFCR
jgi:DNA-binding transcriptional ArsR family regulator